MFTANTQERILSLNHVALRLLWFKAKRKRKKFYAKEDKKREANPKYEIPEFTLKDGDIGHAYVQAYFRAQYSKIFHLVRETGVDFLQGGPEEAERAFKAEIAGTVCDIYSRKVLIPDNAYYYFYKADDGSHIIAPEHFSGVRAKRMRWIRKVITTTREIYVKTEKKWRTVFYIGTFKLPCETKNINHFIVVVRDEANKPLTFKTAYYYENVKNLLHTIEPTHPHWDKITPQKKT